MTILDAPFRRLGKTLADKLGRLGTIEYTSTGGYSTTTGTASQSQTKSADVRGVVEHYSDPEIDGTTVRRGDLKWTVPALNITAPSPNDLVDFGDKDVNGNRLRYTIQAVRSHYSGDQAALYELQLRR